MAEQAHDARTHGEPVDLRAAELPEARHARAGHRYRAGPLGDELGAKLASASLYALPPGQGAGAYHYELTREEWLIVVDGNVTLRTPTGERPLRTGDVVCFRPGPDGAHAIRNDGDSTARYLMVSTKEESRAIVYPDSERVAVIGPGFKRMLAIGEDLDYWQGEP